MTCFCISSCHRLISTEVLKSYKIGWNQSHTIHGRDTPHIWNIVMSERKRRNKFYLGLGNHHVPVIQKHLKQNLQSLCNYWSSRDTLLTMVLVLTICVISVTQWCHKPSWGVVSEDMVRKVLLKRGGFYNPNDKIRL